jgi:hypothetical protein
MSTGCGEQRDVAALDDESETPLGLRRWASERG